jgi:cell division transport system ATP-binding protein
MIEFKNVSKIYGKVKALDSVSFSIEPGEFVFILGPSGVGKTTVRKLLIKELEPTEGEITVGEFQLSQVKRKELPTLRQQIGVIFQDYQLLPDRTAAENIALSLEISNKPNDVIKTTVVKLLELIGLAHKGNLFPTQLSGGEAQRVVIARALATDPAVLFADEPTGNLDRENSFHIVQLLQKINAHGTTIIMATHDTEIVQKTPARIITLEKGKITGDTGEKPDEKKKNTTDKSSSIDNQDPKTTKDK